jgi:hypothetical protein
MTKSMHLAPRTPSRDALKTQKQDSGSASTSGKQGRRKNAETPAAIKAAHFY